MFEYVAQRCLFVGHEISGGVTHEGVAVQTTTRTPKYGAIGRQRVGEVAGLFLVLAEEGQLGIVAGPVADGGGDVFYQS